MNKSIFLIICYHNITELSWEEREPEIEIAPKCDFDNNDMAENNPELNLADKMDCALACQKTTDCTHFTFNGVECWKKNGSVSKSDAFEADFEDVFCGIVTKNESSKRFYIFCKLIIIIYRIRRIYLLVFLK